MHEKVRKELDALRGMVLNWKESYRGYASPEGGNEFLVEEYLEEIEMYIYPYVRRMYECQHLTQDEARDFMNFCYDNVKDLRNALVDSDSERFGETFWRKLLARINILF
ncbi:MAG: hypothetical protein DRG59_11070 [Deltaproteobacteria bacterium]|nr:MAG: hypothetical protein DRG59_11070 [Deltaproteobacteria bacterium]HEC31003.1 hypothetical protein [Deltaproteobacteria bacterium]